MKFTQRHLDKLAYEWSRIAKEKIELKHVMSGIYVFCSEIAALRLAYHFLQQGKPGVLVDYSENLETWFFRLDV